MRRPSCAHLAAVALPLLLQWLVRLHAESVRGVLEAVLVQVQMLPELVQLLLVLEQEEVLQVLL